MLLINKIPFSGVHQVPVEQPAEASCGGDLHSCYRLNSVFNRQIVVDIEKRVHVRDCECDWQLKKSIGEKFEIVLSCWCVGNLGLVQGDSHGRETGGDGGGVVGTFAAGFGGCVSSAEAGAGARDSAL